MNNVIELMKLMLAGGMLGASGQGLRACLGLLRLKANPVGTFSVSRLIINLSVGFVVGCICISVLIRSAASEISTQDIFSLVAFGYAGGDVIERIVRLFAYRASVSSTPGATLNRGQTGEQPLTPKQLEQKHISTE